MDFETIKSRYRDDILAIAREHHADNVRIFGSVVRDEAHEASDVDVLVHFEPGASYMDLAALDWKISELLGVKADVVADTSLKEGIRERILREAKQL